MPQSKSAVGATRPRYAQAESPEPCQSVEREAVCRRRFTAHYSQRPRAMSCEPVEHELFAVQPDRRGVAACSLRTTKNGIVS